jgi:plastocyanin
MDTPMVATRTLKPFARPTLRAIMFAALVLNALTFVFDIITTGLNDLNVPHIIIALVVAGIAALRFRWAPLVGALLGALLLVEASIFLTSELTEPASAGSFAWATIFIATALVGLVAGIGAAVQNYRAPRTRPLITPPAPGWAAPALLALSALALGGIITTAIQPRGALPGVSPETLAALPTLSAKDYQFEQATITAKVGETVALRLDNADTSTHYFDIDELNVHATMLVGKSNLALFKPTQPGTYTFYCRPHADKAARSGMVGTLVVEP